MLAYAIGLVYWILFTVLILAPGSVLAEWVAIEARYQTHPLQTAYIDPATLEREGNLVTLPVMIDWKTMQGGRASNRFSSTMVTKQFDCAAQRVRTLGATDFYGHMGTGEVIGGSGSRAKATGLPLSEERSMKACGRRLVERDSNVVRRPSGAPHMDHPSSSM